MNRSFATEPLRKAFWLIALLPSLLVCPVEAHIGSPDVFYDGLVGPYPARITVRMPGVVPGRAQINVRVQTSEPVNVSFLPVYAATPITNAPPPDPGLLVPGESNLYTGELWLMTFGGYSIDVRIRGAQGEGGVQLPVNSVATKQLPLPSFLGTVLLVLGSILVCGGLGIVAAAARDSIVIPGALPGKKERRKGLRAAMVTGIIFVALLVGGKKWWLVEEADFRRHLRGGAWPDLGAQVSVDGGQRILRLELAKKSLNPSYSLSLVPDHGKLLHVFLVREPSHDAFAHLHPLRKGNKTFEAALPPLPEGTYKIFCDLTFEGSGLSATATNSVLLPPVSALEKGSGADRQVFTDPDDSWASYISSSVPTIATSNTNFHLAGGAQVICRAAWPFRAGQDPGLRFDVRDANGDPIPLEPYMGMFSHAAVLRTDGTVFAHIHPSGNFSMAAQSMFAEKAQREALGSQGEVVVAHATDSVHEQLAGAGISSVVLPYEFPAPGEYRLFVQFKIRGTVQTAVFGFRVSP